MNQPPSAAQDQAFAAVHQLVCANPQLLAELRACRDLDEFVSHTLAIAAAAGYTLTAETLYAAAQSGRRAWRERWLA